MSQNENITEEVLTNLYDTKLVMFVLGETNPGAYNIASKLFDLIETVPSQKEDVMNCIKNLIIKNITGLRLWYIFKNEAKMDQNKLIYLNLDKFTEEYFITSLKKIY